MSLLLNEGKVSAGMVSPEASLLWCRRSSPHILRQPSQGLCPYPLFL